MTMMNKDQFGRLVGSGGNPLKVLARQRLQARRRDRIAAKAAGVTVKRAEQQRVAAALNRSFALLTAKVRGG